MSEQNDRLPVLFHGPAEAVHPLARYGESRVVRVLKDRIMATDKRAIQLNEEEAILTAQAAIAYRLDPFMGELWSWVTKRQDGTRVLSMMKGRDGTLKIAKQNATAQGTHLLSPRFTQIVDEAQRTTLLIPQGALAFECKQEDHLSVTTWQARYNKMVDAGAKHDQILETIGESPADYGLGVIEKEELVRLSRGSNKMTHVERCQKRAHTAALRKRWAAQEFGQLEESSLETDDYIIEGEWLDLQFVEDDDRPQEEKESESARASEQLFGEDEEKPDRKSPAFWPNAVLEAIVEKKYAENVFEAAGMLSYSTFDKTVAKTPALLFSKAYRAARDEGDEPKDAGPKGMAAYLKTLKGGKS